MTQQTNRAIILAGGQGTRLKPYTTLFPKALVPLEEMPVLELVIRQLKHHGFTELTLAVGHLSELIEAYFGDGRKWGVHITYAREDKPLGTAGPLKALADLPDNFLVMNADIVSDINYRALFDFHCRKQSPESLPDNVTRHPEKHGAAGTRESSLGVQAEMPGQQGPLENLATIAVYRRTSKIDFGVLEFDSESHLINNFIEKPVLEHSVSMGIYVFNRRVREFIPEDTFFGFDQLMRTLIQQEQAIRAYPFSGYWLDIGRVDDYETAVNDFHQLRPLLLPETLPAESSPSEATTEPKSANAQPVGTPSEKSQGVQQRSVDSFKRDTGILSSENPKSGLGTPQEVATP